jgi:predicted nucleic acid-binding protein
MDDGLMGVYKLIIPDILPFRAYWVLTTKWGIEKQVAKEIISEFVANYSSPIYVGLKREYCLEAFNYSNQFKHDIYDCYYLALAKQENATSILTTDTDFKKLCEKIGLKYENPVPLEVLKKFHIFK